MEYRPTYHLDRIRMMLDACTARSSDEPFERRLRWLRTITVDLSHTPESEAEERLSLLEQSAVRCAAERVIVKHFNCDRLPFLVSLVTQRVQHLTMLDLRGCYSCRGEGELILSDFLSAVADAHCSSLRRLYLPWESIVAQSTLDRFTQLEELDVSGCKNITNVDFCSATLRVLYANLCYELTDEGLRNATKLEVLHVSNCPKVTSVSAFAHSLLELDGTTLSSAALSSCLSLQVLHAEGSSTITSLQPFASRLRELDAKYSALSDVALAEATGLVKLSANGNRAITTVAPFGESLRRLDAECSGIDDAGLVTATNLVYLNASEDTRICNVAPFSSSLLELNVSGGGDLMDDGALSAATNLIWLNVSFHKRITTVESCRQSLRHLVAVGQGPLTNDGLATVTQLRTLDCRRSCLTTMKPSWGSIEELITDSAELLAEIGNAPHLHRVETKWKMDGLARAGFSECVRWVWCRSTE